MRKSELTREKQRLLWEEMKMIVADARKNIDTINNICDEADKYYQNHKDEAYFLIDAVAYLCDYRKVLERAIEKSELPL